jgi:alpha-beta hydrolase superfamily lysophospholipase
LAKIDVAGLRAGFSGPHELVHTSDGKTLFVRRWDAEGEPPASILIFHGITAYSGPYGPMMAEQLSAAGFTVYGMDLRGHGLSDGARGDYPSEERLIEDLTETVRLVRSKSKKLVILGHSLGALSAIIAVNNIPSGIDGLILVSIARRVRTGVYRRPSTGALLKILLGVTIMPGRPVIDYRREGMIGLDDPLFNFRYSSRFYSVMYGLGALTVSRMMNSGLVDSPNLKFNEKLKMPLLVAVGEHDELFATDYSREFFEEIPCDDKEFFVVPGARHAVFPKDAWGPLLAWLRKRFG